MSARGRYKDPNSLEARLRRLGYEPIAASLRNFRNEGDGTSIIATSERDEDNRQQTRYKLQDQYGIIYTAPTLGRLVEWLEAV